MTREERRAWWLERIAAQAASGWSGRAWCEQEDVSYRSFIQWRRRLGAAAATKARLSFVRVLPEEANGSMVQLRVGSVRIEVRSGFDAVLLRQVVVLGAA